MESAGRYNDDNDETELERIRAKLVEIIEAEFESGSDAVYLSRLGNALGDDRLTLERLSHQKLSSFVAEHLEYPIQQTGKQQNILYLVRPGVDPVDVTFKSSSTPRYSRRFWAAFAAPLSEGEERHINLNTQRFGASIEQIKVAPDDDIRPIPHDYVSNGSESASEIAGMISSWLADQGLQPDAFLQRRGKKERADYDHLSILDQMIRTLDGDQLRRVSLPLDVVASLLKR